ncbi:glucan 1,3-beta-glucosidase Exg3 [Schizosaccharomyces cryophilus OY26]|uniref:Glucan 1,3-beta-glucosidase Exg3 n=1 Tax=Schizosaccharomyces cryophilus (strain OY26 / ATCC MYA-4695 / CBS 11777 / NBRC 106824 / NRRL Y48691) TaxID=653667 RepID=S9XJQ1_SCHCR|nr:glucan 1,3-beta-glucosidase Exg3 [Schizosaccharomyces cryophilus OY26]EPY53931.1 glucan 1,3-beta-glucosidase Exg3 [Schizosaccharomyces cryophilus OY26]
MSLSTQDVYIYRKQFGVNLGAWFCQERWINDSLFEGPGDSEFDAVQSVVQKHGIDGARGLFENHWRTWISTNDFSNLQQLGVNTVRIPIGYWTLGQSQFLQGTPFQQYAGVYQNSLNILCEKIRDASTKSIGVLVDFHGVYGQANGGSHSGTSSGKVEFFSNSQNQQRMVSALQYAVSVLRNLENLVGIEVINEPEWGQYNVLNSYYQNARKVIPSYLPTYIGDGWDKDHWVNWVNEHENDGFYVVDHHSYFCFGGDLMNQSPKTITSKLNSGEEYGKTKLSNLIVGEWSCVLTEESWQQTKLHQYRRKQFGKAQVSQYLNNTGGCDFWTYKFLHGKGGDWDFRVENEDKIVQYPKHLPKASGSMPCKLSKRRKQNYSGHCYYWDHLHPDGQYQHELYLQGWNQAWSDHVNFLKHGALIGFPRGWTIKRMSEIQSQSAWEYRDGMNACWTSMDQLGYLKCA